MSELNDMAADSSGHLFTHCRFPADAPRRFRGGPDRMSRAAVLRQNYPNPFNPSTTIEYRLHEGAKIILKVHDLRAREVRTLVDRDQSVGAKNVVWDGRDNAGRSVGSRVYVYRLRTGDAGTAESRKMLLVR